MKLLNYDLSEYEPPIMSINYTPAGARSPHTHFVVIGGYEKIPGRADNDGWYRAHNPMFHDNADTIPKSLSGTTQYGMKDGNGNAMFSFDGMVKLYRYTSTYSDKLLNTSRVNLTAHSPVEMQVIDPDGNLIGYDPDTGEKFLENPMSLYYEDMPVTALDGSDSPSEPVKKLDIIQPKQGNYIFKIFGTGDGPYTIDMEWIKSDGTANLVTSLTGTAAPSLSQTYRITYSPTGDATLSQTNQAPVANAGSAQIGEQSYDITLDGSASYDPDGDPLAYTWSFVSKPNGSAATLSDPQAIKPTFTPDIPGTYTLQLVVNDHFANSGPSVVTITATPLKSRISVTPNFSTPLAAGSGYISFDVSNIGRIGVTSGIINISLTDPSGMIVASGSQTFSIGVGQSTTIAVPVNISSLKFGNYTLTYTQSDETRTGTPATATVPNSLFTTFSFDKINYRVRDAANLTLNLIDIGKFNLDNATLTVSIPDAGYTNSQNVSVGQGQTLPLQFTIPIPATMTAGQHNVSATLALSSGSSIVQNAKIALQDSILVLGLASSTQYAPGDTVTITVENQGSVDTAYASQNFTLTDNKGNVIYQGSVTDTIQAEEKKTLANIQIPTQIAGGLMLLNVVLKDTSTGKLSSLYTSLNVNVVAPGLLARTDKDIYVNTDAITATTTLASGAINIDNGTLNIKVNKYRSPSGGMFSLFLPQVSGERCSSSDGHFCYPAGIATAPDGSVYVVDDGNNRIQHFDINGNLINKWGNPGGNYGQLNGPLGVAVAPDGSVYVADTNNQRVLKFDKNGNYIARLNGWFYEPFNVAVAPDGSVYVADTWNDRVQKFDSNGNFITLWGTSAAPTAIAVGPDGSVYVTDNSDYINKYDSAGNLITILSVLNDCA